MFFLPKGIPFFNPRSPFTHKRLFPVVGPEIFLSLCFFLQSAPSPRPETGRFFWCDRCNRDQVEVVIAFSCFLEPPPLATVFGCCGGLPFSSSAVFFVRYAKSSPSSLSRIRGSFLFFFAPVANHILRLTDGPISSKAKLQCDRCPLRNKRGRSPPSNSTIPPSCSRTARKKIILRRSFPFPRQTFRHR